MSDDIDKEEIYGIGARGVMPQVYLNSCYKIISGNREVPIVGGEANPEILKRYALEALVRGEHEAAVLTDDLHFLNRREFLSPETYAEVLNLMTSDQKYWYLMDEFIQYVVDIEDFPLFDSLVYLDREQIHVGDHGTFSGEVYQCLYRAMYPDSEGDIGRESKSRLWVKGAKAYQILYYENQGARNFPNRWNRDRGTRFGSPGDIFDTRQAEPFIRLLNDPEAIPDEIAILYKIFLREKSDLDDSDLLTLLEVQYSELLYHQLIPQVVQAIEKTQHPESQTNQDSVIRRYLEIITAMWNNYYTGESYVNLWNTEIASFSRLLGRVVIHRQKLMNIEFKANLNGASTDD